MSETTALVEVPRTSVPMVLVPRKEIAYETVKVNLRVGSYVKTLNLTKADIARTLKLTTNQLDMSIDKGWLPRCVWRYASEMWGRQGLPEPKSRKAERRLRVSAFYEKYGAIPAPRAPEVVLPPVTPEPPPPPATVSWEVFQATLGMLVHQNAVLLAEKALLEADNTQLYRVLTIMKTDSGFERLLNSVDAAGKQPLPIIEPAPEVKDEISKHLHDLAKYNGNGAVISDLAKRIPFAIAFRS